MDLPRSLQLRILWYNRQTAAAQTIIRKWRDFLRLRGIILELMTRNLERLAKTSVPVLDAVLYVHITGQPDDRVAISRQGPGQELYDSDDYDWFQLAESRIWWGPHIVKPMSYRMFVGMVVVEGNETHITIWRSHPREGMRVVRSNVYRRRRLRNGSLSLRCIA